MLDTDVTEFGAALGAGATDGPISSTANPRVKAVLRLRDRRGRDESGLTVVDGLREIGRALDGGVRVEAAYVGPAASRGEGTGLVARLVAAGASVVEVSEAVQSRLAFGDRAEGIVAVIRRPTLDLAALDPPPVPLLVVIEGVEKPGNLGAVMRSVDGAGADGLIAADPRADLWSPNAIRASLGTIFSVPAAAAPGAEVLAWCRRRGIRLVAARTDADATYTDADLTGALALVLGSEAAGLTDAWRSSEVEAVRLPMHGVADSLNVSVATAVLLYEARRQRDRAEAGRSRAGGVRAVARHRRIGP